MEKKNNCLKVGFSRVLCGVMAIFLCAAPSGAEVLVGNGETLNVDYQITEWVTVQAGGALNVWPDGIINYGVYAQSQSEVNIYGGEFPYGSLTVQATDATVAIYGAGFTLTNASGAELDNTQNPQEIQITNPSQGGSGTLTWEYQSSQYTISFWSFADIKLTASAIALTIDIKPGSDPNPINQGSNGLIPVAIFTTDGFNAADVDPGTVTLNGAGIAVRGKAEKLMARLEDVDGDGDDDLILQVETQSEGDVWESGPVTLTGKTYGGEDIEGTDEVVIVPPK